MATRTFRLFKLRFRSPLHLSKGKEDDYGQSEETLHSDTLKSALYVCARQLFGDEGVGPDARFFERFRVSSAFPFAGNELFFPKPNLRLQGFDAGEIDEKLQPKKHKKIAYLGQQYFEDLITAQKLTIRKAHLSADGRFVSDKAEALDLANVPVLTSQVQQRVTIPADYADDPVPYYVDRLFFRDDAGLWFAFEGRDDTIHDQVLAALKLLGDNGIGTDRSVGNGQFEVVDQMNDTLTLTISDKPTHQLLLSLWCPQQEELSESLLMGGSYGLIRRGGYIASPVDQAHLTYRKKSIYMFSAGSVFPTTEKPLVGKIENLKPDALPQNVWRDGLVLTLPITKPADRP